jgi:hypothetical protein
MIKSVRMSCVGHVACTRALGNANRIFVVKCEGKILHRRYKHRWEGDTKVNLKEIR